MRILSSLLLIFMILCFCTLAKAQDVSTIFTPVPEPMEFVGQPQTAGAGFFQIDPATFSRWEPSRINQTLIQNFPLAKNRPVTLLVQRFDVLAPGAQVVAGTSNGDIPFQPTKSIFLRGSILGVQNSHVYIAMFPNYSIGYIIAPDSTGAFATFSIAPLAIDRFRTSSMIVYDRGTGPMITQPFDCGTSELMAHPMESQPNKPGEITPPGNNNKAYNAPYVTGSTLTKAPAIQSATLAIQVAVDCAHDEYLAQSSDSQATVNYALADFGAVSDINIRENNAAVEIPFCRVWTSADPYHGPSKDSMLIYMRSYWNTNEQGIARASAFLLSGTNFGGIAYLNVLCQSLSTGFGYGVAGLLNNVVFPKDGYLFDVHVVAHELGHNIGSPHTQSCSWNPPIDSCVAAEGGCYAGTHPVRGTIMSYCNQTPAGSDLTYGNRVDSLLRLRIVNAPCSFGVSLPIANAGPDKSVCNGTPVTIGVTATGGTPPYSYLWRPATGLSSTTVATPTASPVVATTYIVRVTDANLLRTYDTVVVSIHPSPSISAGSPQTICKGFSTVIGNTATGGAPPYSYIWSPNAGLSNDTTAAPIASPAISTTYTVIVLDSNGCQATDSVRVTVHQPPIAKSGGNKSTCLGSSVTMGQTGTGGTPSYHYSWSPGIFLSDSNSATPIATPPITTKYYFTVTDNFGCQNRDSAVITVNTPPAAHAGPSASICFGGTTSIGLPATAGSAPYSYQWSPAFGLTNLTAATTLASPRATTKYFITVTDRNGCQSQDSVLVTVAPPLIVSAGQKQTICSGLTAPLTGSISGGTPPYSVRWSPSTELSDSTTATPIATPHGTRFYLLSVTDANSCSASDSVQIQVSNRTVPAITGPSEFCQGDSIVLSATSGLAQYKWSTGGSSQNIAVRQSGSYYVVATNSNGCSDTSNRIAVTVHPLPAQPTISRSGDTLISSPALTYQWRLDGNVLAGATQKSYVTSGQGKFTVEISDVHGCTARSPEFTKTLSSVTFNDVELHFNLIPNPSTGIVNLISSSPLSAVPEYYLTDVLGKRISHIETSGIQNGNSVRLDLTSIPEGIYFLHVLQASKHVTFKVIKE